MGASIQHEEPIQNTFSSRHESTFSRDGQWAQNKAKFRSTVKQIKFQEICRQRMKQRTTSTSGPQIKSSMKLSELVKKSQQNWTEFDNDGLIRGFRQMDPHQGKNSYKYITKQASFPEFSYDPDNDDQMQDKSCLANLLCAGSQPISNFDDLKAFDDPTHNSVQDFAFMSKVMASVQDQNKRQVEVEILDQEAVNGVSPIEDSSFKPQKSSNSDQKDQKKEERKIEQQAQPIQAIQPQVQIHQSLGQKLSSQRAKEKRLEDSSGRAQKQESQGSQQRLSSKTENNQSRSAFKSYQFQRFNQESPAPLKPSLEPIRFSSGNQKLLKSHDVVVPKQSALEKLREMSPRILDNGQSQASSKLLNAGIKPKAFANKLPVNKSAFFRPRSASVCSANIKPLVAKGRKLINVRTPRGRSKSISVSTAQIVKGNSKGIARLNAYNKRLKRKGIGPMVMIPRLDCIQEENQNFDDIKPVNSLNQIKSEHFENLGARRQSSGSVMISSGSDKGSSRELGQLGLSKQERSHSVPSYFFKPLLDNFGHNKMSNLKRKAEQLQESRSMRSSDLQSDSGSQLSKLSRDSEPAQLGKCYNQEQVQQILKEKLLQYQQIQQRQLNLQIKAINNQIRAIHQRPMSLSRPDELQIKQLPLQLSLKQIEHISKVSLKPISGLPKQEPSKKSSTGGM